MFNKKDPHDYQLVMLVALYVILPKIARDRKIPRNTMKEIIMFAVIERMKDLKLPLDTDQVSELFEYVHKILLDVKITDRNAMRKLAKRVKDTMTSGV